MEWSGDADAEYSTDAKLNKHSSSLGLEVGVNQRVRTGNVHVFSHMVEKNVVVFADLLQLS